MNQTQHPIAEAGCVHGKVIVIGIVDISVIHVGISFAITTHVCFCLSTFRGVLHLLKAWVCVEFCEKNSAKVENSRFIILVHESEPVSDTRSLMEPAEDIFPPLLKRGANRELRGQDALIYDGGHDKPLHEVKNKCDNFNQLSSREKNHTMKLAR